MADHMERHRQIGLRIAYYRKSKRLTQEKLAELVDCSASHLSHIESPGSAQPVSLDLLFAIADTLGVPPVKFFEDL